MAASSFPIASPAGPIAVDPGLPRHYLALAESRDPGALAGADAVRARLHDPDAPLPAAATHSQQQRLRAVLGDEVLAHPDTEAALALATQGMYIVETLYGGVPTGRVHPIVGDLEQPQFGVYAHYHNGFGLLEAVRVLSRHTAAAGSTVPDFLDSMVADLFSDAVYGNGRRSDNATGYDELRSAQLVHGRALAAGYPPERAERLREAVLGTAFDEASGEQAGREACDPVVTAVAGVDLHILSTRDSVAAAIELAIENGCSRRVSADRVLGRAAAAAGRRLRNTTDGLTFIDTRTDLRSWLARTLRANAGFTGTGYRYPEGWLLEDTAIRAANAQFQHQLADRIEAGELSAVHAYTHALAYQRSSRTCRARGGR